MADQDTESDQDLAFSLQVEESMVASLIEVEDIPHQVSEYQTLELVKKFKQEEIDQLEREKEVCRIRNDLKRRVHDREVALEISRIPEEKWRKTGDHFQKPFYEGSSSISHNVNDNNTHRPFRLYFKGLINAEKVENSTAKIASIGFAICDPSDNLILNGQKLLVGDWKGDFADQELELKVEAKALIEGLTVAFSLGIKNIDFFNDNLPLHQYFTMRWLVNQQNIATIIDQVLLVRRNFEKCTSYRVGLNDIKFAVKLARDAIDSQTRMSAECSKAKDMTETCSICLEDTSVDQMFAIDGCLHWYCYSCMQQHVEVKLLNGVMPRCPHQSCKTTLHIDSCRNFLSSKLIDMMSQRIKEDSIPVSEKVYCPYPKCSTLMSKGEIPKFADSKTATELLAGRCLKCYGYFCIRCKVPWHSNMNCNDFQKSKAPVGEEALLKTLAVTKFWRQCKKCNHMIELSEGCYHITCRCGHEFCYTCGSEWKNKKATCSCPIWDERNIVREQQYLQVRGQQLHQLPNQQRNQPHYQHAQQQQQNQQPQHLHNQQAQQLHQLLNQQRNQPHNQHAQQRPQNPQNQHLHNQQPQHLHNQQAQQRLQNPHNQQNPYNHQQNQHLQQNLHNQQNQQGLQNPHNQHNQPRHYEQNPYNQQNRQQYHQQNPQMHPPNPHNY